MKIGIICEGHTDRVVITNILKGLKGIDSSQIIVLRPDNSYDETDLANLPPDSFSNWTAVKSECESRTKISKFLSIEGQDFVIVHIDTAESGEYGVERPTKNNQYSSLLRERVVNKIKEWLDNEYTDEIIFAVAIEETEAWVLTIYDKNDSAKSADPKKKLQWILGKKDIEYEHTPQRFSELTKPFTKAKKFRREKFRDYNESLHAFCSEIETKLEDK